ncbi:MAG: cupin domain-containing protein [Pseudomonadota bacterium]
MWQLHGLDSAEFIAGYWQKKPCVIRNAFVEFESPVSAPELAGLACEPDVHCRLVLEKDGPTPWHLRYGPFSESDFLELPTSHYSLLVSECEKWLPELTGLIDQFRFIPDWRIDDLMISYAPEHGSVGPHVDEYDVFLLQAEGQRRWQYTEKRIESPSLIPDLELAILSDFNPDQEVILNPGDMLYLPPGYAHHGVALEPCLTYSIGFRAPLALNALESMAMEIDQSGLNSVRYQDPDLEIKRHPAEITDQEIEKFSRLAMNLIQDSNDHWQNAIGKMLSDSPVVKDPLDEQPIHVSDLCASSWIRHPETRLLFHTNKQTISFYFNGRCHCLPYDDAILEKIRILCDKREWSRALILECISIGSLETLLLELAFHEAILPFNDD